MKKFNLFFFLLLFATVFITFSCKKSDAIITSGIDSDNESNENIHKNEATWITSGEEGSKWWIFKFKISIGHTAADCGNKCVMAFGEFGHIDCRGFGEVCNHTTTAKLIQSTGGALMLVLEDPDIFGDELDFLFPDRALYITNPQNNTDLWLNIPEQVLLRDSNGVPFEILDIWFSEEPELENK